MVNSGIEDNNLSQFEEDLTNVEAKLPVHCSACGTIWLVDMRYNVTINNCERCDDLVCSGCGRYEPDRKLYEKCDKTQLVGYISSLPIYSTDGVPCNGHIIRRSHRHHVRIYNKRTE